MVKLYSSLNCAKCKTIKYFLDKADQAYEEILFESAPERFPADFSGTFPWVEVDGELMRDTAPLHSILNRLRTLT